MAHMKKVVRLPHGCGGNACPGYLRDQFLENDQSDRGLKAIDMLVKLEDRINRIEHRVGLFEQYMWGDPCEILSGAHGRREVDDGEFLEVDDYDRRIRGQNRTKRAL